MKKLTLALLLLASCKSAPARFDFIDTKTSNSPAKTSYTERLVLLQKLNKDQLTELLHDRVAYADQRSYTYSSKPTHVFIYLYKSKADCAADGSSWVAMFSRVMGKDEGIQFKN